MPDWLKYLLILAGIGIAIGWVFIITLVVMLKPKGVSLLQGLRLIPDVVRLVKRLVMERGVASTLKLGLAGLLLYLVSPVDLIPDVVPVIGTVDDVILFIYVLRTFIAKVGPDLVNQHWPGNKAGAELLYKLLRMSGKQPTSPATRADVPQLPEGRR